MRPILIIGDAQGKPDAQIAIELEWTAELVRAAYAYTENAEVPDFPRQAWFEDIADDLHGQSLGYYEWAAVCLEEQHAALCVDTV